MAFWATDFWAPDLWAPDFWEGLGAATPAPPAAEEEEILSGGYGWESEYRSYRQRTKRKRKVRRIIRKRIKEIDDPVDREIAERLHAQLEKEAQDKEVAEFQALLTTPEYAPFLARAMANRGLQDQYMDALERKTFSSLQRLARMIEEQYREDEEILAIMMAML